MVKFLGEIHYIKVLSHCAKFAKSLTNQLKLLVLQLFQNSLYEGCYLNASRTLFKYFLFDKVYRGISEIKTCEDVKLYCVLCEGFIFKLIRSIIPLL